MLTSLIYDRSTLVHGQRNKNNNLALVQITARYYKTDASHYLNSCWPRYMSLYGITRPQWVKWFLSLWILSSSEGATDGWAVCHQSLINSSPPGRNGCHFADDIFRSIFVNEKFCILIKILLKFFSKGPIDNNPALVSITALNRQQAIIWTNAELIHWHIYAALGGHELRYAFLYIITAFQSLLRDHPYRTELE